MKQILKYTISLILITILSIILVVLNYNDKKENKEKKVDTIAVTKTDDNRYMKGVWVRTIANLDFPKTTTAKSQKQELSDIVLTCSKNNITDIFFQVRPKCDALYKSSINEWSSILTGTQGKKPGYDPLAYLLSEASKYNINIHAWLNPYRIVSGKETLDSISKSNFANSSKDILIYQDNIPYLNPASKEVENHLEETVKELLENYPTLASIHLDDYYYPANYSNNFPKDSEAQNALRNNITNMIISLKTLCNSYNIKFGVSPAGVWKNSCTAPSGSNTLGNESYYSVCADTKLWVEKNYIDYIIPQLYWNFDYSNTPYDIITKWWSDLITTSKSSTKLYIGQGIYKEEVAREIYKQLEYNSSFNNISGSVFYCYEQIKDNTNNCADEINKFYNK